MNIDKWGGAPEKWASVCEVKKKAKKGGTRYIPVGKWKPIAS